MSEQEISLDSLQDVLVYLGYDPDTPVLKARMKADESLVVIVDLGIKGCPKHIVAPEDFMEWEGPLAEAEAVPEEVEMPPATDAAIRLAEELGIGIYDVEGTGSGGVITKRDVQKAAKGR
jgi:pyruvate/2-oxoglutarate dehydrogenase complex dihydrolipoamide acyltransferase (E2) component